MRICIDTGIIKYSDALANALTRLEGNISLINDDPTKNGWDCCSSVKSFYSYKSLLSVTDLQGYDDKEHHAIVKELLSDYRTLLIAERTNISLKWSSILLSVKDVDVIVGNSMSLIRKENWDYVFYQATPHDLLSWVFARTCEILGLSVIFIQTSPIPWKFWLVNGIDEQNVIFPRSNDNFKDEQDEEIFDEWLSNLQADYTKALPSYEKDKYRKGNKVSISWSDEILRAYKRPYRIIGSYLKKRLLESYRTLSGIPNLECDYVVVFLHYQPERTSLPEGGEYVQQWRVVHRLRAMLSKEVKIYVKEHPSTFLGKYDYRYRNPSFYKDLDSLHGVRLVDIDYSPFDLIDNARYVITLTGTVGVQALCRGKRVLSLGASSYRSMRHCYTDIRELSETGVTNSRYIIESDSIEELKGILLRTIGRSVKAKTDVYSAETRLAGHEDLLVSWLSLNFK